MTNSILAVVAIFWQLSGIAWAQTIPPQKSSSSQFVFSVLDGSLEVLTPSFIRIWKPSPTKTVYVPELKYTLLNRSEHDWKTAIFRFQITGRCTRNEKTEVREWPYDDEIRIEWDQSMTPPRAEIKTDAVKYIGYLNGCEPTTNITVQLVLAKSEKWEVNGLSGETIDLLAKQKEEQAKRAAKAAAEREETARRIVLCRTLYNRTANKRLSDLTVNENRMIRACELLGYFGP